MMKSTTSRLVLSLLLALSAGAAWADGAPKCTSRPESEWKPHTELEKKLVAEGWVIRRMEKTKYCYEVYAKDPKGKRVEAFFDPVTLNRVED
ncbi:PepSY domain-containing protein [Oxalobacteraceae bacterium A2-2]